MSSGRRDIGYDEACRLTLENVAPGVTCELPVVRAAGRVAAEPVFARVDSPSVDVSLKDGYAVVASDLSHAGRNDPAVLKVIGRLAAGDAAGQGIRPGQALRILSGAPIPPGADAVVAEEFTDQGRQALRVFADAAPGRNVLEKGEDVADGELIAETGQVLLPQFIELLVAGGVSGVTVFGRPKIGLLATGSEILLPGSAFVPGKIYASNIALQQAWLAADGFDVRMNAAGDSQADIGEAIREMAAQADVLITSGGAWKGDRDLVVKVLESLGCHMIFHRVRMGPGKAVGMGILDGKPVFVLPGGPASNETAFMMLVYPALRKIAGFVHCPYLWLHGRLAQSVQGQSDWTQIVQCDLGRQGAEIAVFPKKLKSRMAAMARTPAVIKIPEGVAHIPQDSLVSFICYDSAQFMYPVESPSDSHE
ncbi:MAG: molybdopterin molybdotransferase MoeA [Desulfobacterales bacterium]|nr:molybdopterin molybdotransferase MoeA [Desulfobacterales bacterium]